MDKIDWFNDFYSDMFSLNFDSTCSIVELKRSWHFVIDTINIIIIIGLRVVKFRGNFKSAPCYALV